MNISSLYWNDKQKQTFHNLPILLFTGRIGRIKKGKKAVILSVQHINIQLDLYDLEGLEG